MTEENHEGPTNQQAIIRGEDVDLEAILLSQGLKGEHVVETEDGKILYFSQGPEALEKVKVDNQVSPQGNPGWDDLSYEQKRTVLLMAEEIPDSPPTDPTPTD